MSTVDEQQRSRVSLPAFTSIQDHPNHFGRLGASSIASSSRSNEKPWTTSSTDKDNGSNISDASGRRDDIDMDDPRKTSENQGQHPINGTIRRSKRASGGFLIGSSPTSSHLSRSTISHQESKGKNRESYKLSDPPSRAHNERSVHRLDTKGSPLSSNPAASDTGAPTLRLKAPQHETAQFSSTDAERHVKSRSKRATYGFDTDPARIVDMALRLTEGRRRHVSGRGTLAEMNAPRRTVSSATSRLDQSPSRGQRDLRAASGGLNDSHRHHDPRLRRRELPAEEKVASSALPIQDDGSSALPFEQDAVNEASDMSISKATQNRVNKAKEYFELAYEHRRLLSHLPPLRSPDAPYDQDKPGYVSRRYNPLQYCRNRKLRFRERQPKNAEGEGWHDVLKVRAWVDAVINNHAETRHDPLECVRLPPLTLLDDEQLAEEQWKAKAVTTGKPRRPKSDWVTHPGDMLADQWWTEQGMNKQRIYNRDNEPIFPAGTKFRFSGWRNPTPIDVPAELKSSSPEASPTFERQVSVPAPPALPTFESAHKDHGWNRARLRFGHALDKTSKGLKQREDDAFNTSTDSFSSDNRRKQSRGRKREAQRGGRFALSEGDPFAPSIQSSNPKKAEKDASPKRDQGHETKDYANVLRHLRRSSTTLSNDELEKHKAKRSLLLDNLKLEHNNDAGRNSLDYDSTAPPTPAIPSIAINLSPPVSRSPSPDLRRRSVLLTAVKDKLPGTKERIDRTDFANAPSSSRSKEPSSKRHSQAHDSSRGTSPFSKDVSRGTSPFTRLRETTPTDDGTSAALEPRGSNLSKTHTTTNESIASKSHRVRGIFKGGRIAELVGNEVSRVGDFIWKRDPPRRSDITDEGSISGYESDSEDLPEQRHSQQGSRVGVLRQDAAYSQDNASKANGSPASETSVQDSPQYHIQGLPSFTSPFQRDKDAQDRRRSSQSPGGTSQKRYAQNNDDEGDPVSTSATAARAGKSPRFERLAPPKLNIRAATPDRHRKDSYGFGAAFDLGRTRSASQLYNSAINGQSSKSRRESHSRPQPLSRYASRSGHELARTISNDSVSVSGKPVKTSDMLRVRAILVAIAVKATNIADFCDAIPPSQSPFLYSSFECTGASGDEINKHLPARRRDEHFIAGQHLITHFGNQGGIFNDKLSQFTQTTTMALHKEIQILEDRADKTLFPRLQSLSDTAGQLAQKLTTTSTLAVKSVNDDVSEAMRLKRRGTVRFGRWFGYKLIEIGVVGVLWLIWLVVTVVRFALGLVRGCWKVFAWLFWLR